MTKRNAMVFLGGSCDPTTWRADKAIPAMTSAGVKFYNPQVADWKPELVELETKAKEESEVLLFVVDGQTRAIASMLEVAELASTGRKVVLVIDNIPDGMEVGGEKIAGRQLKDLNRARAYLADIARRHQNTVLCQTIDEAIAKSIQLINS